MESHFTKAGQENTRLVAIHNTHSLLALLEIVQQVTDRSGLPTVGDQRLVRLAGRSFLVGAVCRILLEFDTVPFTEVGSPAIIHDLLNLGSNELVGCGEEAGELLA